jgi:hypothetical protein
MHKAVSCTCFACGTSYCWFTMLDHRCCRLPLSRLAVASTSTARSPTGEAQATLAALLTLHAGSVSYMLLMVLPPACLPPCTGFYIDCQFTNWGGTEHSCCLAAIIITDSAAFSPPAAFYIDRKITLGRHRPPLLPCLPGYWLLISHAADGVAALLFSRMQWLLH